MNIAVMQPYFLPYLGYFQLIAAVDLFVVWDDVQYINRGWVNRNRILLNSEPVYITLPLDKAAQNANINERNLAPDIASATAKILGQLHAAYRKAPHYTEIRLLVEQVLSCNERNLAGFLFSSLKTVCAYLAIDTTLQLSSDLEKHDGGLSGSDRIISICKTMKATTYINAIGGRELYSAANFSAADLELRFIEMLPIEYSQQSDSFVPFLSIVDVMMFNDKETIQQYLQRYTLQV